MSDLGERIRHPNRMPISIPEALKWRENWTAEDREKIESALALFDDPRCYVSESNPTRQYVGVIDGEDPRTSARRVGLYINAGFLWFATMRGPDGEFGLRLSTFSPHEGVPQAPEKVYTTCPTCNYVLLPSGVCDNCAG